MIAVDAWLAAEGRDQRARLLLQVHDELVFECDEAFVPALVDGVRALMQGAASLDVPLLVEAGVGANWDEAH